jgi:site-specific DNA-methyltransferase (adenine-specific)
MGTSSITESPFELLELSVLNDNTQDGIKALQAANARYRVSSWPEPFDETNHKLILGDARDLSSVADSSIHLIVTSPPYWTLKKYKEGRQGQLGDIGDYDQFLDQLDAVWRECFRVLIPGGRICCVVGDVCLSRRSAGRHLVMPLHSDIQVRVRKLGLDCLTPIVWYKIANGATEAKGNGAGFYGKPFQPGAIVKNDVEHILFFRKPGAYRAATNMQKALSMLTKEEVQSWLRAVWEDIPGASTRIGHPAPFPVELAERLIRMFSFAGDTVLDPFVGVGSTSIAAASAGRNSIGVDIELEYLGIAYRRLAAQTSKLPLAGPARSNLWSIGF